jgi:hypothetical protein
MAGKSDKGLGDVKQRLKARYENIQKRVKPPYTSDLVPDMFEAKILGLLEELGITYPIDFSSPPADVQVAARQGRVMLQPAGSSIGNSMGVLQDNKCLTFKAREKGFLVIDSLDIIMEDPIAEGFTIKYVFDGSQTNSIQYQIDNSIAEPGHWKFNRIVLADTGSLQVCVINPNAYAGGVFSWESRLWRL